MSDYLFEHLAEIVSWMDADLDASVSDVYKEQPLAQDWARVAKVTEEAGEAVDVLIALTGQNPRKPESGEIDVLLDELADVALCGLYAIQHFTKDADITLATVMKRGQHHVQRRTEQMGD